MYNYSFHEFDVTQKYFIKNVFCIRLKLFFYAERSFNGTTAKLCYRAIDCAFHDVHHTMTVPCWFVKILPISTFCKLEINLVITPQLSDLKIM